MDYVLDGSRQLSQQYALALREKWGQEQEKTQLVDLMVRLGDFTFLKDSKDNGDLRGRAVALRWCCAGRIVPHRDVQLGFAVLNTEIEHKRQLDLISTILEEHKTEILVLLILGNRLDIKKELEARI